MERDAVKLKERKKVCIWQDLKGGNKSYNCIISKKTKQYRKHKETKVKHKSSCWGYLNVRTTKFVG